MTSIRSFADYSSHLCDYIRHHSDPRSESVQLPLHKSEQEFNDLALALFHLQFEGVIPYRQLCDLRKISPDTVHHWSEIPAVPAAAFKEFELSSLSPNERVTIFHSSGTTEQKPSRHFHNAESLSLYEASLLPWFQRNFLSDWEGLREQEIIGPLDKPGFIFLTPSPALAPHSSLVHMFETIRRETGSGDSFFAGRTDATGAWTLDMEQLLFGIRKSICANRPIAILGTAFSFVHLLDHFAKNNRRYRLATGSRVLETGGYKGRSRSMPKSELHQLITRHLGIPDSHIICEYGMSELSSQAYDSTVLFQNLSPDLEIQKSKIKNQKSQRLFRFPPWARAQIISPESGKEVSEGETGLIRIFDLANVRSVLAIQTEDLGVRHRNGFDLVGRAALAEPRGCSLIQA